MKYQILIFIILVSFSCASHREFLYFQQSKGTAEVRHEVEKKQFTLQPGDILAINISSQIPEATAAYKLNAEGQAYQSPSIINDYLVDDEGYIDFPILGRMKVGGLTIKELRGVFVKELSDDLRDPIVNIRLINFSVVVIGEVRRPSTYTVTRQQVTVFEALGLAGDMTDQADREHVLIVREVDGERVSVTLDLSQSDILKSDFYYLKQNDVLYVPPTKRKSFAVSTQPYSQILIPIIGVVLSITSLILTISRTQ